ncbi:sensor histidine kinase [Nocardioides pacificus]
MRDDEERDARRLTELQRYLQPDAAQQQVLQTVVDIAALMAGVPMAAVNLMTDTQQLSIATVGIPTGVCDRDDAMCNVAIVQDSSIITNDASRDPRFSEHPAVDGTLSSIRFYAAHPLRTDTGTVIGTLCVFDTRPHTLTSEQQRALAGLADRVVEHFELEHRTRQLQDLTEELQTSLKQLSATEQRLQRSNERLAAFAGQVTHDLNNPLTAISMSLDMLGEHLETLEPRDETAQFLTQRAHHAAARMQTMVQDVLTYARSGGARVDLSRVDLRETVAAVLEDLAAPLADAEVTVGHLPVVEGDPVQLRVALQNLVSNAAKFTSAGQRPRIRVTATPEIQQDEVTVAVIDHGIGIAAADRDRVATPFVRLHDDIDGSGIGLATVKRILEAHGRHLEITETAGGGTTVSFRLSAAPTSAQQVPLEDLPAR